MMGLLIKDIQLMKNQKNFFGVVAAVACLFAVTQDNPYFVLCYVTFMFAMFTVTSFSYDEVDNGLAYLFAMPIEKRDYVLEKYIFAILTCLFGLVCTVILVTAAFAVKVNLLNVPLSYDFTLMGVTCFAAAAFSLLFLAVAIPVELKFGVEKGRIGFLLIFVVFFACYYVLVRFGEKVSGVNPADVFEKLLELPLAAVIGMVGGVSIVLAAVSFVISMRIMEGKEC